MSAEIIYEKKYPHIDPMEEFKTTELEAAGVTKQPTLTFDEFLEKIYANTVYILIPERIKASEEFIRNAIEVSKLYELDTRIERHVDHISVNYSFNCGGGMGCINRVFGMADRLSFFKDIYGRDITISIDFYTHTVA